MESNTEILVNINDWRPVSQLTKPSSKDGLNSRTFKRQVIKQLMENYGAVITIETVFYWVEIGRQLDFDYLSFGRKLYRHQLYLNVASKYGELIAYYLTYQLPKALALKIPLALSDELKEFITQANVDLDLSIDLNAFHQKVREYWLNDEQVYTLLTEYGEKASAHQN
ncbi:hypothetical protein [Colwellia sp. MEBiC06753]